MEWILMCFEVCVFNQVCLHNLRRASADEISLLVDVSRTAALLCTSLNSSNTPIGKRCPVDLS